ncbi:hypothetical protein SLS62_006780 [Diatrype stigma]|uniref:Inositol polyphosphate-related phosphatase domain-containing protein n=1 Tax=Diatrype stigma TaxID=117547 RepID=A0AAN9YRC1_9PEZI
MDPTNREPSVGSGHDQDDFNSTTQFSLSRAVHSRKAEYVRPRRVRIKVGTWNVASCPGTDKDLARWFVDGQGLEPQFDSNLARLHLSEDSVVEEARDSNGDNQADQSQAPPTSRGSADESSQAEQGHPAHQENLADQEAQQPQEPQKRLAGGNDIGLYVLGLQEIVPLSLSKQSFYSDPTTIAKWQDALEAALPRNYQLISSCQLVGVLLLIYASPEVADNISNESTISIGTGVLGYMGNKGAVATRLVLGETTRIVFTNCHLASGHDQTSLDRRCWDYNKIANQTKFAPIEYGGVEEEDGDKIGDEDFIFMFGDLNFRLDGLPGDDIRRLLTLHTRGEYDINKKPSKTIVGDDGVIVMRSHPGDDGSSTPGMVSRETSFDDDDEELPDPDDFLPDPHDDPASLQATLDSLLPHDQLKRVMNQRKAFHEGWREGPITFLPTYKYDVGTVGLFDSSEKMRAPSWCDRILYRTRKDWEAYHQKCKDEVEAKKRDEEMKQRGIDQAADDESVLFDYDPNTDSSAENLASGDTLYDYDEYDDVADDTGEVVTKDGSVDKLHLDTYTSHQRIISSDHKPMVAIFTLDYDAVVPELKAKVHAEVARELDRAENEGRPAITIIVDGKDSSGIHADENITVSGGGVDFGEVGYLQERNRSLTIANTGRVPATFSFVEKPGGLETSDSSPQQDWLSVVFDRYPSGGDHGKQEPLGTEVTLEPGETVNIILYVYVHDLAHVRALNEESTQLEDVLVLRVADGRDHFIALRAAWQPTCFGRSLDELIRIPRGGGIRALANQRKKEGKGGAIPYSLEVHHSSPAELFKLTEAVERLAERAIADENMLGPGECGIPRDSPGWPFDERSWLTIGSLGQKKDEERVVGAEKHPQYRAAVIEALEADTPLLEALGADVPTLARLETTAEVLLLFLRGMPDGIVTAPLWARIEQALPNLSSHHYRSAEAAADDARSAVLDVLAASPYHNIAFVFLTAMLSKVASELLPLGKAELDALNARAAAAGARQQQRGAGGALGFRRGTGSSSLSGGSVDEVAIQRRIAWERRAAEIFGRAVCRAGGPDGSGAGSAGGSAAVRDKERRALEEKTRGLIEVFIRRDGG